ncbi:TetR/AcrR family transcriptional regulator [Phyllobacterium sp. TAF24]|uniref:TetR/AcrR family transcriptional regulator n=1 Tax=Phyllobacterium sp. TAF24 TaxID=3233068 RepID=UPI003F98E261
MTTMSSKSHLPAEKDEGRDTYHHGALRDALLQAATDILRENGPEGFSLREAARRAGVSPGAPAHHFGSVAGLLTEVAIDGFVELTEALRRARTASSSPGSQLRSQGESYVSFAIGAPGRFQLMFRHDLLLKNDERLEAAGQAALAELEASIRDYLTTGLSADESRLQPLLLGAWSTVHGFAHLAIDGKLQTMAFPNSLVHFVAQALPEVLLAMLPDR